MSLMDKFLAKNNAKEGNEVQAANIDYEPNGRKVHHSSLSRTSYDLP